MIDSRGTNIPDDEVVKFIEQVHHYQRETQKVTGVDDQMLHPQSIREFLYHYYHMFPTHEHWMETSGWHHRNSFLEETVMSMCASYLVGRGSFTNYPNETVFGEVNSKALHFATIDTRNRSYMIYNVERDNG